MAAPRWPRPLREPTGRAARVLLFAFAPRGESDLSVSAAEHGIPEGGLPEELTVSALRDADFTALVSGPVGRLGEEALGPAFEQVRSAQVLHRVMADVPDPSDLGYLQAAWALAHALVDGGALAVLDAHSIRWFPAQDVAARPRTFTLQREISIVFETERRPGEDGHLVHTRGLAKFGRPDLVLRNVAPERKEDAGFLLDRLARDAAFGLPLAPGTLDLEARRLTLAPFADEGSLQIALNNDGLLVSG